MKDVAELAGVSSTTVSFVINQTPNTNIPAETQERVWEAVRELKYRPNVMARGLRVQKTHTIGFISDEVATTPFAGRMLQGAQELAWEHNYLLLLINTGGNQAVKQAAVEMLLDRQVDGIIYATMYHRQVHPPKAVREVPTVLLDCYVDDGSLPSVVPDEVRGGRDATAHLLAKGHRRVGYIGDVTPVAAERLRRQGYQVALEAAGLAYDPSLTEVGPTTPAGGYECAMQLLQGTERPTAFFCFNDRMAMGVYDAARELGLRIPEDLAVVGYDDQEIIAAHLRPSLTTMKLPHAAMGRWAVQYLLGLIHDPEPADQAAPIQQLIECPLIERASV
jgi:LacI family transcriptional regulator